MKDPPREQIASSAILNLGQVFDREELEPLRALFDADRAAYPYFWHPYSYHQQANYDALITTPAFDGLIQHPRIMPVIEELMGGPVCFGEIGLRYMGPYDGPLHRKWHRDRPTLAAASVADGLHPVDGLSDPMWTRARTASRFRRSRLTSQSLEMNRRSWLAAASMTCTARRGPAHCSMWRRSTPPPPGLLPPNARRSRSTTGTGIGRPLSNDSGIPAALWRDHPDAQTRAFYGVLNRRTRLYMAAFGR